MNKTGSYIVPIDLNDAEVKAAIDAEAAKRVEAETGGLKAKNQQLLDELKPLKETAKKFDGVDLDEYNAFKAKKKKDGDDGASPEELRKRVEGEFTPKLTAAEERAAKAEQALNARIIDGDLTSAMVASNVSKDLMPAAKALLKSNQKIEVTESGATVDGKPLEAFVKEWVQKDGKAFVAANANSGGGGGGGNGGGAGQGKKRSEFSSAERTAYINEHGSEGWLKLPK